MRVRMEEPVLEELFQVRPHEKLSHCHRSESEFSETVVIVDLIAWYVLHRDHPGRTQLLVDPRHVDLRPLRKVSPEHLGVRDFERIVRFFMEMRRELLHDSAPIDSL